MSNRIRRNFTDEFKDEVVKLDHDEFCMTGK